jgi:molecular chaperone GrpE
MLQKPDKHQKSDKDLKTVKEELEKDKKAEGMEIETLKQQLVDVQNKYLRAVADYQNLEKRVEKDKYEWIKMANAELLIKTLSIADDLDRAAGFINDSGLNMVRDNLTKLLAEFGIVEIQAQDKPYDHETMECIDKAQGEKDKVVKVLAKGYRLHDRVLRLAKVVVGKGITGI